MPHRPPLHSFGRPFYVKVAGASFVLGACIEAFMIHTGFYDKCARVEKAAADEAPLTYAELRTPQSDGHRGGAAT